MCQQDTKTLFVVYCIVVLSLIYKWWCPVNFRITNSKLSTVNVALSASKVLVSFKYFRLYFSCRFYRFAYKLYKWQIKSHIFTFVAIHFVFELVLLLIFTARAMLAGYMLSSYVSPSVCPSQVGVVQRRLNLGSHK